MSKFSNFLRRLGFLMLGLVIGIFILNRIYKKKNATFDYLPNARTLKSISTKPIIYFSDEAKAQLKQKNIDTTAAMSILNYGKVNFSKSLQHQKPCAEYYIEGGVNTPNINLYVKRCDSTSVILSID